MTVHVYDIIAKTNSDLRLVFVFKDPDGNPIDLTGYSAKMQVKDGETLLLTLDDSDGITLGGAAGTASVVVPYATAVTLSPANARYDLILESGGGEVTNYVQGAYVIDEGVTTL